MPKKAGSRPGKLPTPDSRSRRPVRHAPRPSAAVPVGSEALISTPSARLAASAPVANLTRTMSASTRMIRPARASGLPASTDYGYVFADLRRIARMAAAAFAVLIGLTFVVR